MDFNIKTDGGQICVSPFDEKVWFVVFNEMGHARSILTQDQAQKLIEALQSIIATTEVE